MNKEFKPPVPRGVRNNNPGNLKFDSNFIWLGQIGQDEGGFVIFNAPSKGLRAMAINACSLIRLNHAHTITDLIDDWVGFDLTQAAPYAIFVAHRADLQPRGAVDWTKYAVPIMQAMVLYENGEQPYPVDMYEAAIRRAHRL